MTSNPETDPLRNADRGRSARTLVLECLRARIKQEKQLARLMATISDLRAGCHRPLHELWQ